MSRRLIRNNVEMQAGAYRVAIAVAEPPGAEKCADELRPDLV